MYDKNNKKGRRFAGPSLCVHLTQGAFPITSGAALPLAAEA
jgi:hypothetical protein